MFRFSFLSLVFFSCCISMATADYADAADFGFSPDASGVTNSAALQRAVDQGGTIFVSKPGIYPVSSTIRVGGGTALRFGAGVFLKKTAEKGPFAHVLLNKGATTLVPDKGITIEENPTTTVPI